MKLKRNNNLVLILLILPIIGLYLAFNNISIGNVFFKQNIANTINLQPVKIDNSSVIKTNISKQNSSSVLGSVGCTSGSQCEAEMRYRYQPICTQDGAAVTIGDGQKIGNGGKGIQVTDNSVIEIYEVTVPTNILSGSRYVEDDRMAIWSADKGMNGTYPNANRVISLAEAKSYCPPGSDCMKEVDLLNNENKEGNYEVNLRAKTDQENADYILNASVIERELFSVCPKVQSASPNPNFSNKVAGNVLNFLFQTPVEKVGARTYAGVNCKEGDSGMIPVSGAEEYISCISKKFPFNFQIFASVTVQNWIDCTVGKYKTDKDGNTVYEEPDPDKCKANIMYALEVDALFGSPYRELKNQNAGFYMDYIVQGRTPPGAAKDMAPAGIKEVMVSNAPAIDPFYVSTPCKVRVDGKGIYEIPCIWDMTVYKNNWHRQKRDAIPGEANIPATFEEYWSYVDKQAQLWSQSCY